MRLRNLKNHDEIVANCPILIDDPKKYFGSYQKLFGNNHEIHLEIGMGKGKFIYEMAKNNPDINFIGMEKYTNVLARAINKMPDFPTNLRIINGDAINLKEYFNHEISTIYLNFSDPWPKKRHALRRLTSKPFLEVYDNIFKDENIIIQKTDNIGLFAYSIASLSLYGYTLERVSLDLKNEEDILNVTTEYEEKFMNEGILINYLYAKK